jgi:hypothetical protein
MFQSSTLQDFQRLVMFLERNDEGHYRSLIMAAESIDVTHWESKVLEMNFCELGNFLSFIKPLTERMYERSCLRLNSPIPEVKERITSNALSCPLDQVQPIYKFAIKEGLQNLKDTLSEAMTSPLHKGKRAEQMWRTPLGYLTGFVKFSRIHFPALLRELPDSWITTATTKRIESIVEPSWIADVASFLRLMRSIAPDFEYQAIRRNLLTSQALQKLAIKARALPPEHLSALEFFKSEDPYIYSLITGVNSSDVQVAGSKTSPPPT